jgi:RNA polymerase sigma-70 factor, ECF subfamily
MKHLGSSITVTLTNGGTASAETSSPRTRLSESAFHQLYSEAAPKLRAYLRRASNDQALADDLLQESFMRVLRTELPQMEAHQMKAYLYRVASALLADHWRQIKRERQWSLRTIFRSHTGADRDSGHDVSRLFAQMKPREQMLLWLAHVEGFDHQEIAEALQVGVKSVRVLLCRARKKLADLLTQHGLAPEGGL